MHSLTFRVRRCPLCCRVHPLPIGAALCCHSNETRAPTANPPIVHNYGASPTTPSYIPVRAVVWACGCGQTDKQTRVTNIHFASSMTNKKCTTTTTVLWPLVRDQKKDSPTHHPDHRPIFISFFHLPRSIASSHEI